MTDVSHVADAILLLHSSFLTYIYFPDVHNSGLNVAYAGRGYVSWSESLDWGYTEKVSHAPMFSTPYVAVISFPRQVLLRVDLSESYPLPSSASPSYIHRIEGDGL